MATLKMGSTTVLTESSGTVTAGAWLRHTSRNEGLVAKYVSASTVDIDADYLTVYDTNNVGVILNSINLTVNMGGASGANGLDIKSSSPITYLLRSFYFFQLFWCKSLK